MANTDPVADFETNYGQLADDISQQTGLDRSVVLGQIGLESGYGQHYINNNPFGMQNPDGSIKSYPDIPSAAQDYVSTINRKYPTISKLSDPNDQAMAFQTQGYNSHDGYGAKVQSVAARFRHTPPNSSDPNSPAPNSPAPNSPAPNSPAPPPNQTPDEDPDVVAGRKLAEQTSDPNFVAQPTTTAPSNQPEDPDVVAGRKLAQQTLDAPPDATPAPNTSDQSTLGSIKAGAIRGASDMIDFPQWGLAEIGDATGISSRLGFRNADQIAADNKAAVDKYNQDYGNNPLAGITRYGTQAAGTTAAMLAGGGVLGLIGRGLAAVAPETVEAAAPVARFIAGRGGTGTIGRGASLVTNGAGQGAAASAITAGQDPNTSILKQAAEGAGVGAVAAPALKAVSRGLGAAVGVGASTTPEIAALADKAKNTYNIPLTASQITDNGLLQKMAKGSDATIFSGAPDRAAQNTAYQTAIGRQIGEDGVTSFTPDVMNRANTRIQQVIANPPNAAALKTALEQQAALKTIEPIVAASPTGKIDPDSLMQQVLKQHGTDVAYQADNPLRDLAHIGQQFKIGKTESSPLAWTLGNGLAVSEGPSIVGGALHVAGANPWLAATGVPAGILANRAYNAAINRPGLAEQVIKNGLEGGGPNRGISNLLSATTIPTVRIKAHDSLKAYNSQDDNQ